MTDSNVLQLRQLSTVLVAIGGSLNLKEKIFVAIAWMSKASVQVRFNFDDYEHF